MNQIEPNIFILSCIVFDEARPMTARLLRVPTCSNHKL